VVDFCTLKVDIAFVTLLIIAAAAAAAAAVAGSGRHAGVVRHASRDNGARESGDELCRRVPSHVRRLLVSVERRPTRVHETVPALQPRAHRRGDRGACRGRTAGEPALSQTVPRPGELFFETFQL